jgi:hypothetical protein
MKFQKLCYLMPTPSSKGKKEQTYDAASDSSEKKREVPSKGGFSGLMLILI